MTAPKIVAITRNTKSVVIVFDRAVASAGAASTGWTMTLNGSNQAISGGVLTNGGASLELQTAATFANTDIVLVSYSGSNITEHVAPNDVLASVSNKLAPLGVADYSQSVVVIKPLSISGNVVTATVDLHLTPADADIVVEQSPVTVDIGGTFNTVVIASKTVTLKDLLTISQTFSVTGNLNTAATAATEWLSATANKVSSVLGAAKVIDANIAQASTISYVGV